MKRAPFPGLWRTEIGRFEMADAGTLFLDEIGDLPLALQPKLLRVLQEQEFERLGSGRTHRVNVRLIAATHRDLVGMIGRGEFRSDLYYRLNVFPVCSHHCGSAAKTYHCWSRILWRCFHGASESTIRRYTGRDAECIHLVFLARQRARAPKFDRASGNPVERRDSSEPLICNGQEVDEGD